MGCGSNGNLSLSLCVVTLLSLSVLGLSEANRTSIEEAEGFVQPGCLDVSFSVGEESPRLRKTRNFLSQSLVLRFLYRCPSHALEK